jgi:flagellar motor switch protein FliG
MVRRKSLSELVEFEDLGQLDGTDLRAVFAQVSEESVLDALIGVSGALRHRLLTKLPSASAGKLEAQLLTRGPVTADTVRSAQKAVLDALCRLSRSGQIAFDMPEDMVA